MNDIFNFDFDWYTILIKDGLVREGYKYYIGQKMHPYIPKMTVEGYTDCCCRMSSYTTIYFPKNNYKRQLGEFNHMGTQEEAFYSALLNGLYALLNMNVKRVLVESTNKNMVCDVLDILFYSKHKRKMYWYKNELMKVLNHFRLFAIKWSGTVEDDDMNGGVDEDSLDPMVAYIYS
jgi:hypothetical protein